MESTNDPKSNLIIVSNRLPLSIKRVEGGFESSLSSGGLVTSLSGLTKSTRFQWFGWPGIELKDPADREEVTKSLEEHNAIPIFLDMTLSQEHYNGFSSKPSDHIIAASLTYRPYPLADPPLPVWCKLRRYTMASI
jgi:trehalose 6-phosphate synthase